MSGTLISSTWNQNMLMLYMHVFCHSMFSLEIFSTYLTLICLKCLLHMKKHLHEVLPVPFVERSSSLNGTWKNNSKKSTYYILVPSQRYYDFWQLLQNPKVPKIVLGFSNHTQRYTPPYYLDVDNSLISDRWSSATPTQAKSKFQINIENGGWASLSIFKVWIQPVQRDL